MKKELSTCRQFMDPVMGGAGFNRTAAVDLVTADGRATPNTLMGTRLYQVGLQARAEFLSRMERLRSDLDRAEEWQCPLCAATNSGLTNTCQNSVKTGTEVCACVCVQLCCRWQLAN